MSVSSMTGFGAASASEGAEQVSVEIRSVNGKFCEVKARLPRELAAVEAEVVRLVKERVARGSVEVFVKRTSPGAVAAPRVDAVALAALAHSFEQAARLMGIEGRLSVGDLVSVPGVVKVEEAPAEVETASRAIQKALAEAIVRMGEVRRREGAALESDLRARLATLRAHRETVSKLVPVAVDAHRERLRARIAEVAKGIELDPARLEQEVVLFADRTDVTEELVRLGAHLTEFERLLGQAGPVGRQLDFLLQEINREINTTGSKSPSAEVSKIVVEAKAELERIREQVQNVE